MSADLLKEMLDALDRAARSRGIIPRLDPEEVSRQRTISSWMDMSSTKASSSDRESARAAGSGAERSEINDARTTVSPAIDPATNITEFAGRSIDIGGYLILICDLGANKDAYSEVVQSSHWKAATVRAGRPIASQDDVLIFLVASGDHSEWQDIAYRIERDDRVCRKLVWIAPSSPAETLKSLEDFVKRTFLAEPWGSPASVASPELDAVGRVLVKVDPAKQPLYRAWMELLSTSDPPRGRDLAEQLIAESERVDP